MLAFQVLLSRFKDDCERRRSSPISQANRLHKPSCRQPTWQIHKGQADRMMPSYDIQIGSQLALNSIGQMQAITHMSKADLPSNGAGETPR